MGLSHDLSLLTTDILQALIPFPSLTNVTHTLRTSSVATKHAAHHVSKSLTITVFAILPLRKVTSTFLLASRAYAAQFSAVPDLAFFALLTDVLSRAITDMFSQRRRTFIILTGFPQ